MLVVNLVIKYRGVMLEFQAEKRDGSQLVMMGKQINIQK
jgi:hypothetical protein